MEFLIPPPAQEFTGRQLVLLEQSRLDEAIQQIKDLTHLSSIATASDLEQEPDRHQKADIIVLKILGVAIINQPIDATQLQALGTASADTTTPILRIEPEQSFYALMDISDRVISEPRSDVAEAISLQYFQGYRDGVSCLVDQLTQQNNAQLVQQGKGLFQTTATTWADSTKVTWGLQATNVVNSRYSGKGIKIAVLDTGFDLNHPDFQGRTITSKSFVTERGSLLPVQDLNGHGTHCVGTACGPMSPKTGMRYGVAYGAEIYVGKVLNNNPVIPRGFPGEIFQGIEWAISQGCHVISMSLGSPRTPGQVHNFYHDVIDRALQAGSLVIAAAGNDRKNTMGKTAVYTPADAPAAMAVAAMDTNEQVAAFSSFGDSVAGGQVDLIAPGVDIYSSYISTSGYTKKNGTSMATPHVAGIAALHAEANPGVRGQALWSLLIRNARRLPLSSVDAGAGLVQAP